MKRLARGVDAAVYTLHGLLVDVMQPGLEAVAFTLSDTAGLARCSPWTAPVSLKARLSYSTLAETYTCARDSSSVQRPCLPCDRTGHSFFMRYGTHSCLGPSAGLRDSPADFSSRQHFKLLRALILVKGLG